MAEKLMYPRPDYRDLEVHTVLHDLQEDEALFGEYFANADAVLDQYDLDEEARGLLRNRDFDGMVRRGIHPILVVQLQRQIEWGIKMFTSDAAGPADQ